MIRDAINLGVQGKDLTAEMARASMLEMMNGSATPSQIASFITAIRMKGETEEELRGFVSAMRENVSGISAPEGAVDLCGTGGDGFNSFNISTVASFVVAAAGVPVAKHGNRSVSSRSGSADLLQALGVPIDLGPKEVESTLRSCNIGFMFAPVFHRSMRNVIGPRREIGIRTFFNILGPMTNPAGVRHQLIGIYDMKLARLMAGVLRSLGTQRALIVNGSGMDEITVLGGTKVVELSDGEIREYSISPETFGIDIAAPESIVGGGPEENARIALSIMKGERSPRSDIVAMNAGAAIYIAGAAKDLVEGYSIAEDALSSGKALETATEFSRIARSLEEKRQTSQEPKELLGRRIMPGILSSRSGQISDALLTEIETTLQGPDYLDNLDMQELVGRPSVLSILVLNRVLRIAKKGFQTSDRNARSPQGLLSILRSSQGVSIIAEYKPSSPAALPMQVAPDPDYVSAIYSNMGAAAVSVLVEPDYFQGGTELFSRFRKKITSPMLFKDFIFSKKQLEIASQLGADAALIIAKALAPDGMESLISTSLSFGIEPLVELHDTADLVKVRSLSNYESISLIGLNSRDLRTLDVDLKRVIDLKAMIGEGPCLIAESGIGSAEDIKRLHGFDAALIGSSLMSADDLQATLRQFIETGRSVTK